ncbi:lysophospholipid acyltransferase family protein [Clostridium tarantellae]|uniref:1-acyl-sn-glycerol-3-phosphate acyltransferase n=1 Tax=Clostridium tarantellae TaxID=39493 RepID=A0A6I1MQN7_9CLOT|nr:lysophospholipid acyltransferase family protein [Clostridium tarantellae]MPQ43191.1 1-acyl-sn-glycerol-3-phosphate acyltransferase [Clostridium tarantellae]
MFARIAANALIKLPDSIFMPLAGKLVNGLLDKYADLKVEGLEELKSEKGPFIFIGNHLSNSDGLIANKVLQKYYDPYFIAGVKLNDKSLTSLGTRLVKTINITPNSADRQSLNKIVKEMKAGNSIVIFPEGTRSRTGKMIEGKKGVLLIARLTKAKIVPFAMTGTEKLMPINDKNMGAEKFHNSEVNFKIGKPITLPPKEKDEDKQTYDERALTYLMKSIANLLPKSYRGVYS